MMRVDTTVQYSKDTNLGRAQKADLKGAFANFLNEESDKLSEVGESKQVANDQAEKLKQAESERLRTEFDRLLAMSPIELIRYQLLEEKGLTEESLKELPIEEQLEIEALIKERIEQKMGVNIGSSELEALPQLL